MKFKHVFLIGVGGTGSHLVEPLVKLLSYHPEGTSSISIIDGDKFEESNENRQLFDSSLIGENKARVIVKRLKKDSIKAINKYVNKDSFSDILSKTIKEDDPFLVVTAVDNHATRHAVISAIDEGGYSNFILISPGNAYSSGQIVVYAKEDGENLTTHPFRKYPDVAEPTDVIPGEAEGCAALAPSTPQLITANACAAVATLLTVSNILDEKGWFEEVHFNCWKMKMVPQGTPKGVIL